MFSKILARIAKWRRRFAHLHPRAAADSVEQRRTFLFSEEKWNMREERVGDLKMFNTLPDLYNLTKFI